MATAFDVFVSYSRHDQPIVVPVVQLLRLGEGTMVFLDVDSIRPGERWRERLEAAIAGARYVVVFWCAHASGSAEVAREIAAAVQGGKSLVPVLLDDTPLPEPLTDYQWIDMKALAGAAHAAAPAPVVQAPPARSGRPLDGARPEKPPADPWGPASAPAPATAPPSKGGWLDGIERLLKREFGVRRPPQDAGEAFATPPPAAPAGPVLTGGGAGGIGVLNAIAETLRAQLAERAARDDAAARSGP